MQKNIVETIGNTPLIDISEIRPNNAKIFAKLESSNPAGSIKDRVAKYLIESAEKKGNIKKGSTINEYACFVYEMHENTHTHTHTHTNCLYLCLSVSLSRCLCLYLISSISVSVS